MSLHEEAVLRAAFHEVRVFDRVRVPAFAVRPSAQRRAPSLLRPLAAALLVLMVLAPFIALLRSDTATDRSAMSGWTAPTDFLLGTPQAELLRDVPRFGPVHERMERR